VVLGGTFDGLHAGHRAILLKAFEVGEYVTIGLTTDKYVQHLKIKKLNIKNLFQISNFKFQISPYAVRKQDLEQWLNTQGWHGRYTIVPLNATYGPTVVKKQINDYDAIIVSTETRPGAEAINRLRQKNGLAPLVIVEIPMLGAQDNKRISSTRIRGGEIDANGALVLPSFLRPELKNPIGTVYSNSRIRSEIVRDRGVQSVSVGDRTTETFLKEGLTPRLAIIDMQVSRKPYAWNQKFLKTLRKSGRVDYIKSGPGSISREAMRLIKKWGENFSCRVIIVDGEEDLLVLPVLLYAPLGTVVYYGQPARNASSIADAGGPNEGIVRVVVTEAKKRLAKRLLKQFTSK
jgi:pantetheine-phosphate adenylyltransferase